MSAAAFVLAINLFVAAIFSLSFGVVAAYQRSSVAARWMSVAYALGILNVLLEFLLPHQVDPRLVGIAIFLDFLAAISFLVVGLALHYGVRVPLRRLGLIAIVSTVMILAIIDWPRDSLLRMVLYQLPYALVMVVGIGVIHSHRRRGALDMVLMALFGLTALQFMSKPVLALVIGSGASPQGYISSTYAAISQTSGAFVLIANGLLLLLILLRDVMAEMTMRSETDSLSGLYNRRGFEVRAGQAVADLARTDDSGSILICDLDHFKQINDTFGHDCGDRVIASFAQAFSDAAPPGSIAARIGGEEFVLFMSGADIAAARQIAERVRRVFAGQNVAGLPATVRPTASFGISVLRGGDSLAEATRRADSALYEAKGAGRDRIRVAISQSVPAPIAAVAAARI